jgi:hypothetical protein
MRQTRFFRTATAGALSVAMTLGVTIAAAHASQADGDFHNGQANAVATVAGVAPGVGQLSLGMNSGVAVAQLSNSLAQSEAKVLDLGLIGTTLTEEQCDGSKGALTPDQVPQPTTVDNREGDKSDAKDQAPVAGSAISGGHQEAQATKSPPSAHAAATTVASSLGPVVSIQNGRADATTGVIDGKARQAEATVTMDIDIAGVAQLHGLRWDAVHRTGDSPNIAGSFSVASASVGSAPLPTDQLAPVQTALNAALAPSGITVDLPQVVHLTSPNDLLRVTPLTITLKDSPAGKAAVGPALNLTRAQREQVFTAVASAYCKAAGGLLVGDIALDVVSGTGFMTITLGGAEASSGDLVLGNPFGVDAGFIPPVINNTPGVAGSPSSSLTVGAPGAAGAASVATAQPASATGPLESFCESLRLLKHEGCSIGLGWPVGITGLALTVSLGYLDWRRQRAATAAIAEVVS